MPLSSVGAFAWRLSWTAARGSTRLRTWARLASPAVQANFLFYNFAPSACTSTRHIAGAAQSNLAGAQPSSRSLSASAAYLSPWGLHLRATIPEGEESTFAPGDDVGGLSHFPLCLLGPSGIPVEGLEEDILGAREGIDSVRRTRVLLQRTIGYEFGPPRGRRACATMPRDIFTLVWTPTCMVWPALEWVAWRSASTTLSILASMSSLGRATVVCAGLSPSSWNGRRR